MTSRDHRVVTYLSDRELRMLDDAKDEYQLSTSELLRRALREFCDHDRAARSEAKLHEIESKLDRVLEGLETPNGHTHTLKQENVAGEINTDTSPTVRKTREIAERLRDDGPVLEHDTVEQAIVDIAGGHAQTLEKYQAQLKRRGLLYEHPGDPPAWYTERKMYFSKLSSYATAFPAPESIAREELDNYRADWETYQQYLASLHDDGGAALPAWTREVVADD